MDAKELCRPLGRPGYAIDFPVEVQRWEPNDLKPLIGTKVFVQTSEGRFVFANGKEHHITITDISNSKIYGKVGYGEELVEIELGILRLLEWNEKVVKRIVLQHRQESE